MIIKVNTHAVLYKNKANICSCLVKYTRIYINACGKYLIMINFYP